MAQLSELSLTEHKDLRVNEKLVAEHLSMQHMIGVSVSEIPQASSCFPVFMSRNNQDGKWGCTVLTSLSANTNLFMQQQKWSSVYIPNQAKTFPLFLMKKADKFCVGLQSQSHFFGKQDGKVLFEQSGQASAHLSTVTKLLESSVIAVHQTDLFIEKLEALSLLKQVDLQVIYNSGSTDKIIGLSTIDEDKLKTMDSEKLNELNHLGYLGPIYAILLSIYQLNILINKNNHQGKDSIQNVKIEVSKDLPQH